MHPRLLVLAAALVPFCLVAAEPLPKEVAARIEGFPSLFDGSLQGWTQIPVAPTGFSGSDIADPKALAGQILGGALGKRLDETTRSALLPVANGTLSGKPAAGAVAKALNAIVSGPALAPPTGGLGLERSNRKAIEAEFLGGLTASPDASWVVKDGALASTGACRGVLYSGWSASRYRLFFQVRHISGKPDHTAAVLVFCQGPSDGEKPLDALGGVQFQVPNGGHWDYRPGFNNGGPNFTKPAKTTYDSHDWSEVEILVDGAKGTARMAVAQPVGTYAVENLDFSDPAAGRDGPIALQMHNAGLFDEYREIRVEVDPKEDRLLTVK